jgi:hypothetical protein
MLTLLCRTSFDDSTQTHASVLTHLTPLSPLNVCELMLTLSLTCRNCMGTSLPLYNCNEGSLLGFPLEKRKSPRVSDSSDSSSHSDPTLPHMGRQLQRMNYCPKSERKPRDIKKQYAAYTTNYKSISISKYVQG